MATSRTLATRYFALLRNEGYRPKMDRGDDRDATIYFKSEGQTFLLFVDEHDTEYFHLGLAFELAPEWEDLAAATARANELNGTLKVVKVTVHASTKTARLHVEAFLEAPATMAAIDRSITALRNAAREFFTPVRDRQQLDA